MYVSYHSYQRVQRLVNQCEFVRPSSGIPAMAHRDLSMQNVQIDGFDGSTRLRIMSWIVATCLPNNAIMGRAMDGRHG
jgi:hypothetical protein